MDMVWSLLLTGLGIAVAIFFGVWGVIAGRSGQRQAKEAERLSRALNERVSKMAGDISGIREVSVDARQLAEDANTTRDRQLKALTEEHVVTWLHEWEGRGSYYSQHTGRHDALNVRAVVYVDGEMQISERERVRPSESIRFEFGEANLKEEAADRERMIFDRGSRDPMVANVYYPEQFVTSFEVHWTSAAGVQHSYGPKETTESY